MPEDKPEIKKDPSLFPVSVEAISQALTEIEMNPGVAMIEEGEFLRLQNPTLNRALMINYQTNAYGDRSYIEGALWGHRIIRSQSKVNGTALPKLTEEAAKAQIDETIAKVKKMGRLTIADYYLMEATEIKKRDPEYGQTIRNLTKYRPEGWKMVGGLVDVYQLITRADTHSRLSSLNIGG